MKKMYEKDLCDCEFLVFPQCAEIFLQNMSEFFISSLKCQNFPADQILREIKVIISIFVNHLYT